MFVSLVAIQNEKSETVVMEILNIFEKKEMTKKIIGYGADNTNLNFGGVAKKGQKNVWRKLQSRLSTVAKCLCLTLRH